MEVQKIKCPYCGSLELVPNADGTFKCNDCGQTVKPTLKGQVSNVASNVLGGSINLAHEAIDTNSSRRMTASVLAIILGTIGAHFFYLRQYKKGFLCLLIDVIPVLGITINMVRGVIWGIQHLTMSNEHFNTLYN